MVFLPGASQIIFNGLKAFEKDLDWCMSIMQHKEEL